MDIDGLFNSILNDIISKAKRDREVTLTIIEDVGDAKNFNAIFHPYVRVAKVSADSYLIAKTLHDSFTFHSVLGKGHILYSSRVVLAPGSHCFTFTFDGKKHHLNYKHELSILSPKDRDELKSIRDEMSYIYKEIDNLNDRYKRLKRKLDDIYDR